MSGRENFMPASSIAIALASLCAFQDSLSAQVIEGREGEANPSAALFKATAFGAGTGLLIGGAYALMTDADESGTVVGGALALGCDGGHEVGLAHQRPLERDGVAVEDLIVGDVHECADRRDHLRRDHRPVGEQTWPGCRSITRESCAPH